MKKAIFIGIVTFMLQSVFAQQDLQHECLCCSEPYTLFDFWIGEWTVYNKKGNMVGTNVIEKLYDECVLQEKWTAIGKNKGTSYNYYDKADNTWNQVWIDNSGFSLVLKGNYENDRMILKSKLLDGKNGKYYNQITWVNNNDGTVTQIWDILHENGKKKQELFRGIYKKSLKTP